MRSLSPVGTPLKIQTIGAALSARRRREVFQEFARPITNRLGVAECLLVSSGRAALAIILSALREHVGPDRDEVVVPAYTCYSVPSAVVKAGLRVVPCDVDPRCLDFDHEMLERVISRRTLCLVPTHLFGYPNRMDPVIDIARQHGVYVVEDAAQSFGARIRARPVGTFGDVAFFSLGRGKPLSAIEGGVIVVPREGHLASLLRRRVDRLSVTRRRERLVMAKAFFFSLFFRPHLFWLAEQVPFLKIGVSEFSTHFPIAGLSPFQAGLGTATLNEADTTARARRHNALALVESLEGLPGIDCLEPPEDSEAVYLRLPVLLKTRDVRDELYRALRDRGLGASRMYPAALTQIPELQPHWDNDALLPCPKAVDVAGRILTLPTHPLVTHEDRESLTRCIKNVVAL